MDIMLERILSLIPRKPDGKYVHGAKTAFAKSIGLKGCESIIAWESGKSDAYKGHLYTIAAVHNVSVEWLKGETDEKNKPVEDDGLTEQEVELVKLFGQASPELRAAALAVLRAAEEK